MRKLLVLIFAFLLMQPAQASRLNKACIIAKAPVRLALLLGIGTVVGTVIVVGHVYRQTKRELQEDDAYPVLILEAQPDSTMTF